MVEFYYALVLWALNIVVPYVITARDRRGLTKEQLERAWNGASWASAVYFFGPLCLPAHFWVTRRTLRGLAAGMAWSFVVFAGEWMIGALVDKFMAGG